MYQHFWSSNPPCRSLFCSGFVGEFDSDLYLIHQYIGTFFPFTLDAQEAPLLVITDYNATERLGGATYHCTSRQICLNTCPFVSRPLSSLTIYVSIFCTPTEFISKALLVYIKEKVCSELTCLGFKMSTQKYDSIRSVQEVR